MVVACSSSLQIESAGPCRTMLRSLFGKTAKASAKTEKQIAGDSAESIAEAYLVERGLRCVTKNYRCRYGEIDLVMADGETLVFVEVRFRASRDFGGAAESIHVAKQRRIAAAASHYLTTLSVTPACRFDAILVNKLEQSSVEWIKDAFST
jgi:putative endonuclease